MLCYILAQYAPQVHENILLFFRHKKQSHRNCCRILNINLVIGICKSNSSKLWMLPTPTRHLQIQFQQIADASNPGQASANPIPASCRCFHVRSSPLYVSANPIPTSCRCFQPRPGICSSQNNKSKMPTGEFSSQIRWWASLLHLYFIK